MSTKKEDVVAILKDAISHVVKGCPAVTFYWQIKGTGEVVPQEIVLQKEGNFDYLKRVFEAVSFHKSNVVPKDILDLEHENKKAYLDFESDYEVLVKEDSYSGARVVKWASPKTNLKNLIDKLNF